MTRYTFAGGYEFDISSERKLYQDTRIKFEMWRQDENKGEMTIDGKNKAKNKNILGGHDIIVANLHIYGYFCKKRRGDMA